MFKQKILHHGKIWQRGLVLFLRNDAFSDAGNMAFLAMLSMFPFIIFLVALSGFLGQTDKGLEAISYALSLLPPEVSNVIDGPIQGIIKNTGAEILTGSIMLAIWTAAAGVEASRNALIKTFGREHARAMWIRRLESLGVVVIGGVSVIAAMSTLVLGPALVKAFASLFPESYTEHIENIWKFLNLFISPALLIFGLYSVYAALTPRRIKKPYRLPGTLLSLAVLIATAKGLSVYLKYAGNYDVTYGSLAGVVILQLFCFMVAIGFVMGGALNAAYTEARQAEITKTDEKT
ncbi:YihY/virulence factor BrkB family protein [Kordiimonas pumila]|uniref:YihY/virulence factor BrkB family protein n=1 Tax=Kordiimonas pumila TaxID=2161677 RepID=A0ABV7D116_9PROT|nr:YihY/virulence factor BrkB family protein [Kordiimonas pumila]